MGLFPQGSSESETYEMINSGSDNDEGDILKLQFDFQFRVKEFLCQAHIFNEKNFKSDDFQFLKYHPISCY